MVGDWETGRDISSVRQPKRAIKIGDQFGFWVVVEVGLHTGKYQVSAVRLCCSCGEKHERVAAKAKILASKNYGNRLCPVSVGQSRGSFKVIRIGLLLPASLTWPNGTPAVLCKCSCGEEELISSYDFRTKWDKCSICRKGSSAPIRKYAGIRNHVSVGDKFGNWEVIEVGLRLERKSNSELREGRKSSRTPDRAARCKCSCGVERLVVLSSLLAGISTGCAKTHDISKHPLYGRIVKIIDRCYNIKNPQYDLFGGRGITVYPQWKSDVRAFIDYVEEGLMANPSFRGADIPFSKVPPGYNLSREDYNGNFEPGNLRWAAYQTQVEERNKFVRDVVDYVAFSLPEDSYFVEVLRQERLPLSEALRNRGSKKGPPGVWVRCKCGTVKLVAISDITRKQGTKSCGCSKRNKPKKTGPGTVCRRSDCNGEIVSKGLCKSDYQRRYNDLKNGIRLGYWAQFDA